MKKKSHVKKVRIKKRVRDEMEWKYKKKDAKVEKNVELNITVGRSKYFEGNMTPRSHRTFLCPW